VDFGPLLYIHARVPEHPSAALEGGAMTRRRPVATWVGVAKGSFGATRIVIGTAPSGALSRHYHRPGRDHRPWWIRS
jgi:hypothetical protein